MTEPMEWAISMIRLPFSRNRAFFSSSCNTFRASTFCLAFERSPIFRFLS